MSPFRSRWSSLAPVVRLLTPGLALSLLLGLTLSLVLGLAACVPSRSASLSNGAAPANAAAVERLKQDTAKLYAQNDADALAAAAVLLYIDARASSVLMSAAATAKAPDRPDLAWLQSRICASTPNCDPSPAERALRKLDPANSAGWLGALDEATRAQDESAIDAALAGMAKGERFDLYVNPLVSRLAPVYANAKVKPLADAVPFIFGQGMVVLIPAFRTIGDPCKGEALAREQRLQSCRAIAASLSRGDALLTRSFGAVLTLRTWPAESDEAKAALEARRQSHYLTATLGEVAPQKKWSERHARDYVQILAANRSEDASARAQIIAAGREPYPPAGWVEATFQ